MCEFCIKHGEGEKWYLQARNYGLDLAADVRRRRLVNEIFGDIENQAPRTIESMRRLNRAPALLRSLLRGWVTRRMKRDHFGQVVPLEDVREVLGIANCVVRTPCVCRSATRGDKAARYCFGIAVDPKAFDIFSDLHDSYAAGPETDMTERLEPDAAIDLMRDFERQGLVHTIWTFITPFIAGLCNCDRSDCMAMISSVGHDVKGMFKAEYVAGVDWERCEGCRACMRHCQFGAIGYSATAARCMIDQQRCWGCGVCRAGCRHEAISLSPRAEVAGLTW